MIGNIIYGETCQGTLNYVLGKGGMRILGYGNTFSQDITPKFFGSVLHFQGQRNATKNRYAHISLNLPHGEHLDDATFFKISKEYMDSMGYGEQPYVVVRHTDTKHEHVHIVTTNVKEDGKVLSIFNSYRRNIAAHQALERKYGLSPSPSTKQERELPLYRLPELKLDVDNTQGTRFYIQDVLNTILQKYKVRSFEELARLVRPYHIEIKQTKSKSGRIGVAYGLNNQQGYRTRFINGSKVHRQLSGPKLQKMFDIHSRSKQLPMHRKRLLKQIETTYNLFKTIKPHDLEEVLRKYQNIDIKLDTKGDTIEGYTIFDKSRYVFRERELSKDIRMLNRMDIFGNDDVPTTIDIENKQFKLEVHKLLKEAFRTSYIKSQKQEGLYSDYIARINPKKVSTHLLESKSFLFLHRYVPKDQKEYLKRVFANAYPKVRDELYIRETKKEEETLKNKFRLIGKVLEKQVFNVGTKGGSVRHLFQSLGVRYHDNEILFADSNKHSLPAHIGKLDFPNSMEDYVSKASVRENHLVLEMLTEENLENRKKPTATAIFLPMVFPRLFERMNNNHKQQFDTIALEAYVKYAERVHAPFEKSPKDYVAFFNAKGFYFEKGEKGFRVKSIYTNHSASYTLSKRTGRYLDSIPNLALVLQEQDKVMNGLVEDGRDNLKNLWAGYLTEKGLYNSVAYMFTKENIDPNLHKEIVQHHLENGLQKAIREAITKKSTIEHNRVLRKSAATLSSLLDNRDENIEEAYNGFKDELTDWKKRKKRGRGLSF
ncbi:Relaxase/Mobilisation nuclease domain-containing protein [Robiginitalea myxolifaciens]|uniref:Relaxase/Mobilisation nuclease domain-containing protein n=1 Tax=Robiginitalea myxolifaciens TaxID=400055 RepID=A0A1I6FVC2_9FLAO|nr:relaxase/mobilization nuclease domain-containing protein [Robiginitalea myxolifaciens]SFR33880.1 Relaxase/Mobilisation nuclease domain-containing protein [Robiginitalea myxolifaciens]